MQADVIHTAKDLDAYGFCFDGAKEHTPAKDCCNSIRRELNPDLYKLMIWLTNFPSPFVSC